MYVLKHFHLFFFLDTSIYTFRDPEPFEWYYGYDVLKSYFTDNIDKEAAVLIGGCGNSNLIEDMANVRCERFLIFNFDQSLYFFRMAMKISLDLI